MYDKIKEDVINQYRTNYIYLKCSSRTSLIKATFQSKFKPFSFFVSALLQVTALGFYFQLCFAFIGFTLFKNREERLNNFENFTESNNNITLHNQPTEYFQTFTNCLSTVFKLTLKYDIENIINSQKSTVEIVVFCFFVAAWFSFIMLPLTIAIVRSSYKTCFIPKRQILDSTNSESSIFDNTSISSSNNDNNDEIITTNYDHIAFKKPYIYLINILVFSNICFMASSHTKQSKVWTNVLFFAELFFTFIFTIDLLIQINAEKTVKNYLFHSKTTILNKLDFIIVIVSIISVFISIFDVNLVNLSLLRSLRLLRIVKVLKHYKGLMHIISGLGTAFNEIKRLILFTSIIIVLFVILSLTLVSCNKNENLSFCTFQDSFLSLIIALTGNSFFQVLETNNKQWLIIIYFYFMNIVCLNLFVVVLLNSFESSQTKQQQQNLIETASQTLQQEQEEEEVNETTTTTTPNTTTSSSSSSEESCSTPIRTEMKRIALLIVSNSLFDYFVFACIVLSSIVLIFSTPLEEDPLWYIILDYLFLIVFTLEAILKVTAYGFCSTEDAYLVDNYNKFDFFSLIVLIIEKIISSLIMFPHVLGRLLRNVRLLRPLRLLAKVQGLRVILEALVLSLSGVGNTFALLLLVMLMFGIVALELFGGIVVSASFSFSNLLTILMMLFEVVSLKNWTEKLFVVFEAKPDDKVVTVIFFISFILVAHFVLIKVMVGLIVGYFRQFTTLGMTEKQFIFHTLANSKLKTNNNRIDSSYVEWKLTLLGYLIIFICLSLFIINGAVIFISFVGIFQLWRLLSKTSTSVHFIVSFELVLLASLTLFIIVQKEDLALVLTTVRLVLFPIFIGDNEGLSIFEDTLLGISARVLKKLWLPFFQAGCFLTIYLYLYAVLGTQLFALETLHEFKSFQQSLWTLILIIFGKNWIITMNLVSDSVCIIFTRIYFYSFYFLTFNVFFNLFIASIVDTYATLTRIANAKRTSEWSHYSQLSKKIYTALLSKNSRTELESIEELNSVKDSIIEIIQDTSTSVDEKTSFILISVMPDEYLTLELIERKTELNSSLYSKTQETLLVQT